jgi:hypothetical protein
MEEEKLGSGKRPPLQVTIGLTAARREKEKRQDSYRFPCKGQRIAFLIRSLFRPFAFGRYGSYSTRPPMNTMNAAAQETTSRASA